MAIPAITPARIGRPPKFPDGESMQRVIDGYFLACAGEPVIDFESGEMKLNKSGQPVLIGSKPPTMSGLALELGFNSRTSLFLYEAKDEFVNIIARAKAKVEEYAESRLFDKEGSAGAKFALSCNFAGWREHLDISQNNLNINVNTDITAEERSKLIQDLLKKRDMI